MRVIFLFTFILSAAFAWANSGIQILNYDGQPIAGAIVMIGNDVGNPFEGNVVKTDVNGYLPIVSEWRAQLPITVEADQYVTTSFINISQNGQVLRIHKADGNDKIEIKGETSGYGRIRRDGKVDFSMIFPTIKRRQLLRFNVSTVVSPESDILKILSQEVNIPSNTSIPHQKESYILPITLDKPEYRFYFNQSGNYRLTAAHSQFPLKKVVDDIRGGKSFFDVLNHFTFKGAGQIDINVSSNLKGQNIAIDQMDFNQKISVQAPSYNESKLSMVSIALVDQGGLLFPSDIKKVSSNKSMQLKVPKHNGNNFTLSLLSPPIHAEIAIAPIKEEYSLLVNGNPEDKNNFFNIAGLNLSFQLFEEDVKIKAKEPAGLTFVLQEAANTNAPQFLEIVEPPTINNDQITVTPPAQIPGVTPVGTYLILSEHTTLKSGSTLRTRLWEISLNNWATTVDLPSYNLVKNANSTYRWEVYFLGSNQITEGENTLENVTHLSRTFVEL